MATPFNPNFIPSGARNKSNAYFKKINHVKIARDLESKAGLLGIILNPPVFSGALGDVDYDVGSGDHTVNAAPQFTGGSVTSWSIDPPVAGVSINSAGLITLMTEQPLAATDVTVVAANADGSDTATFSFTATAVSIPTPTIPDNPVVLTGMGTATLTQTVQTPTPTIPLTYAMRNLVGGGGQWNLLIFSIQPNSTTNAIINLFGTLNGKASNTGGKTLTRQNVTSTTDEIIVTGGGTFTSVVGPDVFVGVQQDCTSIIPATVEAGTVLTAYWDSTAADARVFESYTVPSSMSAQTALTNLASAITAGSAARQGIGTSMVLKVFPAADDHLANLRVVVS